MISLVLGGARSGKSEVAERLAESLEAQRRQREDAGGVTFVATGVAGSDDDFDARIALHQSRRPTDWLTVEVAAGEPLSGALSRAGVALLDSLGTWLAGHPGYVADVADLLAALERRQHAHWPTVLVSDEVGLGVHPSTAAGIAFRDALGTLNRQVADLADEVRLVVAGRSLVLPRDDD